MRERVLIAEDSATQREALRALLDEHGFQVTSVSDGTQALERTREHRFDLVITDVLMPGLDGFELCRRLKSELRVDSPAVMLLTTLNNPTDIIQGLESGADNFLTKPYEPEQLISRIQFAVANRRLRQKARAEVGVVIHFLDRVFTITSERQQILDLLLSTYEDAVLQNRRLREREEELRLAKEQLARYAGTLEERLRGILSSVPEVLFSMDPHTGLVHYVSPASLRVFGFAPEEILARPQLWRDIVEPADLATADGAWGAALTSTQPVRCEYRVRHGDGSVRWVELVLSPARDEQGRVAHVDGVARDVTDRKLTEERLRVTEAQLRFAQKMEAIGQLADGIAHDFNNLLGAARGQVDLLMLDARARGLSVEGLDQLAAILDRGKGLSRQLLAFGRRQEMDARPVDVGRLVSGMVTMLERMIPAPVQLAVDGVRLGATAMADPSQIEQVVMNLCVNASDAMPAGGTVRIGTDVVVIDEGDAAGRTWVRPGRYVRLTVTDTGVGMDARTKSRIFEPFFTTKGSEKGTGLGLAVVFGIVKQHGGFIDVDSAPGRGSIFTVCLPFYQSGVATLEHPEGQLGDVVGGNESILIAEDEESLRRTATRLLERLGYRVLAVANGEEALAALEAHGPEIHLLVSDVSMPRMGGHELREKVRHRFPHLRFLFATGYSAESLRGDGLRIEPTELITKPYSLAELAAAVRRVLNATAGT